MMTQTTMTTVTMTIAPIQRSDTAKHRTMQRAITTQLTNIAGPMVVAATPQLIAKPKHLDIKMLQHLKIAWEVPMRVVHHAPPEKLSQLQMGQMKQKTLTPLQLVAHPNNQQQ